MEPETFAVSPSAAMAMARDTSRARNDRETCMRRFSDVVVQAARRRSFAALRMTELNQSAIAQLPLHERVDDRPHHHPSDAERGLAEQDGHQDFPRLRVGLAAHDARVDQIFE